MTVRENEAKVRQPIIERDALRLANSRSSDLIWHIPSKPVKHTIRLHKTRQQIQDCLGLRIRLQQFIYAKQGGEFSPVRHKVPTETQRISLDLDLRMSVLPSTQPFNASVFGKLQS